MHAHIHTYTHTHKNAYTCITTQQHTFMQAFTYVHMAYVFNTKFVCSCTNPKFTYVVVECTIKIFIHCLHIHIYTHTFTFINCPHMHTYTHLITNSDLIIHVYVNTHIYIYAYVYIYTHISIHTHTNIIMYKYHMLT